MQHLADICVENLMFRDALKKITPCTWPVVISWVDSLGACDSAIGTFLIVNRDGWIVTAGHILEMIMQLESAKSQKQQVPAAGVNPGAAQGATPGGQNRAARRAQAAQTRKQQQKVIIDYSSWWGRDGLTLHDATGITGVDLGVGRLDPFDPNWIPSYATFKNPRINFDPGASLCKL
jgi:hypothetical protein